MNKFFEDVWRGLNASPKHLDSRYFYDETGDAIFQEIMACPEYYLTNCELDIFSNQGAEIATELISDLHDFDVVELGAGDCTKSIYLLQALLQKKSSFTYYPIDFSENVISQLNHKLPKVLPGLQMHGLNGDHFEMLNALAGMSQKSKVVLFLGSSIGNIPIADAPGFFKRIGEYMAPGDLMLTGFDLKKDPDVVLAAYNDKAGITKRFNLNLLTRINKTLGADFDISQFAHKPVYNEQTGACRSYLESINDQKIRIGEKGWVHFKQGEQILMEVSQKYTLEQIDGIAASSGFTPVRKYYDSKKWFVDALWRY